jgi:hypothetical protein
VQRSSCHDVFKFLGSFQVRIDHLGRFREHVLRIPIKLSRANRGCTHNELSRLNGLPLLVSEDQDENVLKLMRFFQPWIDNPDRRAAFNCYRRILVAAPRVLDDFAPFPCRRQQERKSIF